MARILSTNQRPAVAGLELATVAANALGHAFYNSGQTILIIVNGNVAETVLTFDVPVTTDAGDIPDKVVTIPAGETWLIGQLPPSIFNQNDGCVYFGLSVTATVTVGVIDA